MKTTEGVLDPKPVCQIVPTLKYNKKIYFKTSHAWSLKGSNCSLRLVTEKSATHMPYSPRGKHFLPF